MDILYQILSRLFSVSVSACVLVLAVILLRYIFARAPKWTRTLMWAVVGLRLLFPFQLAVPVSRSKTENVLPVIYDAVYGSFRLDTGVEAVDDAASIAMKMTSVPKVETVLHGGSDENTLLYIWLAGMGLMLVYLLVSSLLLRKKIRVSVKTEKDAAVCDHIRTPFIFGVFRPVIYLPSSLATEKYDYILRHERAHIQRRDHLIKPAAFLLLTVYWFLPPLWLAYILLCRDIELACDEKAVASESTDYKKEYSSILLECTARSASVAVCPLAFGGGAVKSRVRSILKNKKPAVAALIAAVAAALILVTVFLCRPSAKPGRVEDGIPDYHILRPFSCCRDLMLSNEKVNTYIDEERSFIIGEGGIVYAQYPLSGERQYIGTLRETDGAALWEREDVQSLLPAYVQKEGLLKAYTLVRPEGWTETLFVTGKGIVIHVYFDGDMEVGSMMITDAEPIAIGSTDALRQYKYDKGLNTASLTLDTESGMGSFSAAPYSDYLAFGFYTETAGTLTLTTLDQGQYQYVFRKENGDLVYDAVLSRPGPGAKPEDKTVLSFESEDKNAVASEADIMKAAADSLTDRTLWSDGKGTGLSFYPVGTETKRDRITVYAYVMCLSFEKGQDYYTVTDETVQPAEIILHKWKGQLQNESVRFDFSGRKVKKYFSDWPDGLPGLLAGQVRQNCYDFAYAEMDRDHVNVPIVPAGFEKVTSLEEAGVPKSGAQKIREHLPAMTEEGFYTAVGAVRRENGSQYETYIDNRENTICFIRYNASDNERESAMCFSLETGEVTMVE